MSPSSIALLLLATAIFGQPPSPAPEDWPQWRGPSRDAQAPSFQPPATWPKSLKPAWTAPAGEGYSAPVVSGNRACLLARQKAEELVTCYDRQTGRVLWQDRYQSPFTKSSYATKMASAPFATPVIASGSLYTLGANAILSAYDLASGKLRWRKQPAQSPTTTGLFTGTASSPLIDQGRLIVFWGDDRAGELAALDPATGKPLWSNKTERPVYSSPVIASLGGRRQYILLSEAHAFSVDAATGATLWTIPYKDQWNENIVTPLIAGDLIIFSGVRKPTSAWRVTDGRPVEVWSNPEASFYMSSPVLMGATLYGFNSRQKGQIVALDARTGKKLRATEGRWAEHAHLVAAPKCLIALTSSGELVFISPELRELARYDLGISETWAHPAVIGSTVLVKDATSLHLFRLP